MNSERGAAALDAGDAGLDRAALYTCVGLIVLFIAVLALRRQYFTFGTETDFLSVFVPEARNVLSGEPLASPFHPPLYPAILALAFAVTGDWMAAGLSISWLSALTVLLASVFFFRRLAGRAAAWGSLVALGTSPVFLAYAAQATSDVFFLALYALALLAALQAFDRDRPRDWILAGLLVGAAMLARTNGFTLLLLILAPFLREGPRLRRLALMAAGVATPLVLWAAIARLTGSSVYPSGNAANLAMRYFGTGPGTAERFASVHERFTSVRDVLAYDPGRLFVQYVRDLEGLARRVFAPGSPLAFPLGYLALPGLFVLFLASRRFAGLYGLATLAQLMLMNLKTYEHRYFLFLAPMLGAAAGIAAVRAIRTIPAARLRGVAWAALGVLLSTGVYTSLRGVSSRLHSDDPELEEAVEASRGFVKRGDVLLSRKPHVPFYTGASFRFLPDVSGPSELRDSLEAALEGRAAYLYLGSVEARVREGLASLADPADAPGWLDPVARGSRREWVLYRVALPPGRP